MPAPRLVWKVFPTACFLMMPRQRAGFRTFKWYAGADAVFVSVLVFVFFFFCQLGRAIHSPLLTPAAGLLRVRVFVYASCFFLFFFVFVLCFVHRTRPRLPTTPTLRRCDQSASHRLGSAAPPDVSYNAMPPPPPPLVSHTNVPGARMCSEQASATRLPRWLRLCPLAPPPATQIPSAQPTGVTTTTLAPHPRS